MPPPTTARSNRSLTCTIREAVGSTGPSTQGPIDTARAEACQGARPRAATRLPLAAVVDWEAVRREHTARTSACLRLVGWASREAEAPTWSRPARPWRWPQSRPHRVRHVTIFVSRGGISSHARLSISFSTFDAFLRPFLRVARAIECRNTEVNPARGPISQARDLPQPRTVPGGSGSSSTSAWGEPVKGRLRSWPLRGFRSRSKARPASADATADSRRPDGSRSHPEWRPVGSARADHGALHHGPFGGRRHPPRAADGGAPPRPPSHVPGGGADRAGARHQAPGDPRAAPGPGAGRPVAASHGSSLPST